MAEFASWKSYSTFAAYVKHKARHILDKENKSFLDAVLATSEKRRTILQTGTLVWRSQLDHDGWTVDAIRDEDGDVIEVEDVPAPHKPSRMVPLEDRASEGRVNPKGIPCIYFSTDAKTAVAEARPWVGAYVSVAEFLIPRDLTLVDCTADISWRPRLGHGEVQPEQWERHVWNSINLAFTEPVTRSDDVADYAPTQVLAEAFRLSGFDGIKYGSKLGEGMTIALFDLSAAKLVSRSVYRVDGVEVKVALASNPHYADDYPTPYKPPT